MNNRRMAIETVAKVLSVLCMLADLALLAIWQESDPTRNIFFGVPGIGFLIFRYYLAYWFYKRIKPESNYPWVWFFLAVITSIVAIAIYFLIRYLRIGLSCAWWTHKHNNRMNADQ